MIPQRDLQEVAKARVALAELEKSELVQAYIATEKRISALLVDLRKRVSAGEQVVPGKLALAVKRSLTVDWKGVFALVRERPKVAAAILEDREAQKWVRFANEKDAAAPFVSERLSLDVVPAG